MMRRRSWEQNAVESDLKFWGYQEGKQLAADGYSPESSIAELSMPPSIRPQHKILIKDMTPQVASRYWSIHRIICRFPLELREALIARYALPPKDEDGRMRSRAEICGILGISADQYGRRLSDARVRYRSMLFGECA